MNFKKTAAIVAAAAALTAMALPALAETSFYGSARVHTGYVAQDNAVGTRDTTNFDESLLATSRFGMNASSGDLTGKVEFGSANANGAVYTRLLYGTYKFGFGSVKVGQDYNSYYFISNQTTGGDNVNNNYGSLWDTRQPQIKVAMNNGLYVAFIQPTATATGALTTKILMPKTNIGYEGAAGMFKFGAGVVGQAYQETVAYSTATAAQTTTRVSSALGYVHGTLGMGPAEIKFNLGYGNNLGNMGFTSAGTNRNVLAAGKYTSTTTLEGFVQAKYTVSPTLAMNVGFGYSADTNDAFQTAATTTAAAIGKKTDNRMMVYANVPVGLGKGFTVVPEVAYMDQLDNKNSNTKGAKTTYVGAKWQMDF